MTQAFEKSKLREIATELVRKEGGVSSVARRMGLSHSTVSQALSEEGTRRTATLLRIITTLSGKTVREVYVLTSK